MKGTNEKVCKDIAEYIVRKWEAVQEDTNKDVTAYECDGIIKTLNLLGSVILKL